MQVSVIVGLQINMDEQQKNQQEQLLGGRKNLQNESEQNVNLRATYDTRVLGHHHGGVEQVIIKVVPNHKDSEYLDLKAKGHQITIGHAPHRLWFPTTKIPRDVEIEASVEAECKVGLVVGACAREDVDHPIDRTARRQLELSPSLAKRESVT